MGRATIPTWRKLVVGVTAVGIGAVGVATGAAAAAPCAPGGRAPEARTLQYRFGGLSEAVLRVSVPVENVRDAVPAQYRLLDESTGVATLIAAFGSVEELTVGCRAAKRAVVSEYGVMIDSPDGSAGRHAYYLWQLSDDRSLVNRMRALGAPAFFADSTFDVRNAGGDLVSIDAATAWSDSPNEMSALATEPGKAEPVDLPGVRFWYDGPRGTLRVAYECPACLPRTTAVGSVSAEPGSPLFEMLGQRTQPGNGFFIRTDLEATAELLP